MRVFRSRQNSASQTETETFGCRRKWIRPLEWSRPQSGEIGMDLRVEKLVALMRDDLTQRLPLIKMAQLVNLSRARLCYLFKSESGISASRYLKSLRMKAATVLLSTTFLSVKEIMVRVGFGDESHFVKDFKKIYGITPTEYRKSKVNANGDVSVPAAVKTGLPVSGARALATGRAAIFCATDVDGNWVGAWADDRVRRLATPEEVGAALGFAEANIES